MSDVYERLRLTPEQTRTVCDPVRFAAATTDTNFALRENVWQRRAQEAIAFALEMSGEGYHLYVAGEPGTGRLTTALQQVRLKASARPATSDWIYAHNFQRPSEPLAISLPAGGSPFFARQVDDLVTACRRELRRAFSGAAYRRQRAALLEDIGAQHERLVAQLQQVGLSHGFLVQPTPEGLVMLALKRATPRNPEGPNRVGSDKDATVFPVAIPNHAGKLQLGLLHRPLFPGTRPEEVADQHEELADPNSAEAMAREVDRPHESIWISYCPTPSARQMPQRLGVFNSHHRLAAPAAPWERLKIGGGTPPILTRHGWLILYHGVEPLEQQGSDGRQLRYSAGVMILAKKYPHQIRYRSPEPVLFPELPQERHGMIANVVFPTGIDQRDDLGAPDRFDVYYGMADSRIGVARLDLPAALPLAHVHDPRQAARAPMLDSIRRWFGRRARPPS